MTALFSWKIFRSAINGIGEGRWTMPEPATLIQVKEFFGNPSSKEFSAEWKELTTDEKYWIKLAVGEVING